MQGRRAGIPGRKKASWLSVMPSEEEKPERAVVEGTAENTKEGMRHGSIQRVRSLMGNSRRKVVRKACCSSLILLTSLAPLSSPNHPDKDCWHQRNKTVTIKHSSFGPPVSSLPAASPDRPDVFPRSTRHRRQTQERPVVS